MTLDVHLLDDKVTLDTVKVTRQAPCDCDDTVVCQLLDCLLMTFRSNRRCCRLLFCCCRSLK